MLSSTVYTFTLEDFILTSLGRRELRLLNERSLAVCLRFLLGTSTLGLCRSKRLIALLCKQVSLRSHPFPPQLDVIALVYVCMCLSLALSSLGRSRFATSC